MFYFSRLAQIAIYSVLNQMQRDNTSVDSIYLTKMQICLYSLKALCVSRSKIDRVEVQKLGGGGGGGVNFHSVD